MREKFERRKKRIHYDKLIFITDDQGMDDASYERFDELQAWRKICFTAKNRSAQYPWCYQLKIYSDREKTGHYNDKDWRNGLWMFIRYFDFVTFLNSDLTQ